VTAKQIINIVIALTLGFLLSDFVDASESEKNGLLIFVMVAWLWISEALHISVTALLIPVLAILLGILDVTSAFASFANPIIFLFMGGFALAAALQKHQLDRAFAARVLLLSRGKPLASILVLFFITALLSMWMSNTATVAMMLPLALGLLSGRDSSKERSLFVFVLLGLAYSANIGGMTTLIGSPPNAIAASALGLSFSDWLRWGIPMFAVLFPIMVLILYLLFRPEFGQSLVMEYDPPPKTWQRFVVIVIFAATAMAWIFSSVLAKYINVSSGFDSLVAVTAIVLLIGTGCLDFQSFTEKTNWSILLLFGGGLTLSALLSSSGASQWLAHLISSNLPQQNPWLLMLMLSLFVIFLTELVSNTASAALLVPLFIGVAADLDLSSLAMVVTIALCASCAFMLPVATPPNALVYSTGFVPQRLMMRTGLWLNISMAVVIASAAHWIMF
jgi:sodium-dependent dicarboxylate transporter 2/3/5